MEQRAALFDCQDEHAFRVALPDDCFFKARPATEGDHRFVYCEPSNENWDAQNERVLQKALAESAPHFLKFGNIDIDHLSLLGSRHGLTPAEANNADRERIRRVKQLLLRMRAQTFGLREQLKYCSPLGSLLRSVQRTDIGGDGPKVGIGTIRRLEAAGISSLAELARLRLADLVRMGVRRDLAKQLQAYPRRRLQ